MEPVRELRYCFPQWDRGLEKIRGNILIQFIRECSGVTAPELELTFDLGASLFLARLTSWLRLSYLADKSHLPLQLKAIGIFIAAANGTRFLIEFMEAGGPLTVLEIIRVMNCTEADKTEALKLLLLILNSGRQYKEFLCENGAIRAVAECLGNSKYEPCQEAARQVLHQLVVGNPRYETRVYSALVSLLQARSPTAQTMAANTIRKLHQSLSDAAGGSAVIEPACLLLRSIDAETQLEGQLLLKEIASNEETLQPVIMSLLSALTPLCNANTDQPPPLPLCLQQACASKLLHTLFTELPSSSEIFIARGGVKSLLSAIGNTYHADSQRQASLTLKLLVDRYEPVKEAAKSAMGEDFFDMFVSNPCDLYAKLTPIQTELLKSNYLPAIEIIHLD